MTDASWLSLSDKAKSEPNVGVVAPCHQAIAAVDASGPFLCRRRAREPRARRLMKGVVSGSGVSHLHHASSGHAVAVTRMERGSDHGGGEPAGGGAPRRLGVC